MEFNYTISGVFANLIFILVAGTFIAIVVTGSAYIFLYVVLKMADKVLMWTGNVRLLWQFLKYRSEFMEWQEAERKKDEEEKAK